MAMKTMIADLSQKLHWTGALMAVCAMMVPLAIVPFAKAQSVAPRISSEITNAEQSTLKNSLHPLAQAQFDAGRMPSDTRLDGITMVFNRSAAQEAALQALIAAQQNPASPLYHQWLNPDQFAQRCGRAQSDLDKAQSWLEQLGFSIDRVARSKNAIHFTGTVRQVEQAFSTEMHFYKVNGTQHFAPSTALSVPSALAPTVLGIKNLDDFRPKSHMILSKNARPRPAFTSSQTGDVFFAPGDIATVYDIKPLYNAGVNGAGQSITLVGQSAIMNSDIEAFQNAAGLTVKDPSQFVVPNSGTPTVEADGDESESDLDLEWSGAIAPGATINFVYVGNNPSYGAFDAIQYAIDEQIGTIISSSYGECETYLNGATLESSLEQGTAQGQTIMAAAGDSGSTDCFVGLGTGEPSAAVQEALAVDYPASSAYVTGMGGTEISSANATYDESGTAYWGAATNSSTDAITSALQYIPEMVWNDDVLSENCGQPVCLSAGGGGASTLFPKPSWQTGVPGIPSADSRYVPDLALYASPNVPGYLLCSSDMSAWNSGQQSSCSAGFRDSSTQDLTLAGGTSFDAPIFSGILALINQKQGYTAGQGLINPTLYTLASNSTTYASAFHDITTGNNDCTGGSANCASGNLGFSAGAGYDEASGLGSVDVNNLATAWPASTTSSTLIDTTTSITASSSAPNVGVSDNFTITVTAASGSVTPTGTVNVIVDGGTPISETLSSNGTYVYTASFTAAGSHTIFASYAGNSTFAATPASEPGSVTVIVGTVSSGKGTIAFTPAPSPTTLTVAQGTSGTESISITPAGGYTGTVDLTFDSSNDTALQNLCYQWGNETTSGVGTVAITGTTAVNTTLTLDTNASDCASTNGAMRPGGKQPLHKLRPANSTAKNDGHNGPNRSPVPLTVAFAGLLLAGFLGRGSRKLRALAGLILLATVGLAVTACGGSVSTTVSNPPKGSYTITVTGTDSATTSITATQTFTFVID
jgi:subtilase family serine protease